MEQYFKCIRKSLKKDFILLEVKVKFLIDTVNMVSKL